MIRIRPQMWLLRIISHHQATNRTTIIEGKIPSRMPTTMGMEEMTMAIVELMTITNQRLSLIMTTHREITTISMGHPISRHHMIIKMITTSSSLTLTQQDLLYSIKHLFSLITTTTLAIGLTLIT
jgi:hypothetical protein